MVGDQVGLMGSCVCSAVCVHAYLCPCMHTHINVPYVGSYVHVGGSNRLGMSVHVNMLSVSGYTYCHAILSVANSWQAIDSLAVHACILE